MKQAEKYFYAHPEIADWIKRILLEKRLLGWGGLEMYLEKALETTIKKMITRREIKIKNNVLSIRTRK